MQSFASSKQHGARVPLAATVITPPYTQVGPATNGDHLPARCLSPGAIVCVEIDGSCMPGDDLLKHGILQIRRECTAAPVVLRIHGVLDNEAAHFIERAVRLHVRGIIVEGEPLHETLRRFLTAPLDLPADVAEWLCLRLPRLPPHVIELLRKIFRYAPTDTEVECLLDRVGESARTARARLRKLGLPSPASWLGAARAVHAALRLQRDQFTPVFKMAVELGYCDHSALSHQLMRAFGMRTSRVRGLLGWEWLLDAWLTRASQISVTL
jgi:hypothetical protein